MFTDEEIQRILDGAREDAITKMRENLVDNVSRTTKWELEQKIKATVLEWFDKEMKPTIIETLDTQREIIAQTSLDVAKVVAQAASKAIVEQFAEQLSSEWKRKEFLKAALGLK